MLNTPLFKHCRNTELAEAVDIMMAKVHILMIKENKFFLSWYMHFLKEIENVFPVFALMKMAQNSFHHFDFDTWVIDQV